MKLDDLKWSKTRAQCPHCGNWYTKQGVLGHIRFRHSESCKVSNNVRKEYDDLIKDKYLELYVEVVQRYKKTKRLSPQIREQILDMMLFDFLEKKSEGKR